MKTIKLFDRVSGNQKFDFLAKLNDKFILANQIEIKSEINNGQGDFELILNLSLPEYESIESIIQQFDILEVTDFEKNIDGEVVFTGYIGEIGVFANFNKTEVRIQCFGIGTLLALRSQNLSFTNKDFGEIARSIIAIANSLYPFAQFDSSGIANTGQLANFSYEGDLTASMKELAKNYGGYFHIGADRKVIFRKKSATADRTLIYGSDVLGFSIKRDYIEKYSLTNPTLTASLFLKKEVELYVGETVDVIGLPYSSTFFAKNLQVSSIKETDAGKDVVLEKIESFVVEIKK